MLLRLDERSARAVSDQLEAAARDGSQAFERQFSSASGGLRSTMQQVGRGAGDAFRSGLQAGVDEAVNGVSSRFGVLGQTAGSVLDAIPVKAAAAAVGVGAIALGAIEAGKALYSLGKEWDDITDGMAIRTGKTGAELDNLTNIVGDVGRTTAASLSSIGDIVGQISQSMPDLAQNNEAVRTMASNLAYLNANGQAVNIRELGMAFRAFNVAAVDQVQTFDRLSTVSRDTGIPINSLIAAVRQGAPQFRQFGVDIGGATAFMTAFEESGIDTDKTVSGLRVALKNLSDDSRGAGAALADAITKIKALYDAGNDTGARDAARQIFGDRNFAPFLTAIEDGTLNVESLKKALNDAGISLQNLQKQTDDGAQGWQKLTNTVKDDFGPWANRFFGFVNTQLQYMTGHLTDAKNELHDIASIPIDPNSALGKMLTPGGILAGAPGAPLPYPTTKPTTPVTGLAPNPYKDWYPKLNPGDPGYAGNDNIPPKPGSMTPAQVPYGSLPGLQPGVPMTAEVYQSQTSLWEANHNLEEKRARVQQIQADNNHKAEDLIAAQNDAAKAERDQQEAQMRFWQSQQNAYDKQSKALDKTAADLGEIGAKLDKDFGISKGFAGIVENVTKMLANLAAAPVIGALAGGQIGLGYKPGEAGSGLMGILAGSGAFGPDFQLAPAWARGDQQSASASYPYPFSSAGAPMTMMPSGPVAIPGVSTAGLQPQSMAALQAIFQQWGGTGIRFISGYRASDPYPWHPSGRGLDIGIPGWETPQGKALGDQIYGWLMANADTLGLVPSAVLWQVKDHFNHIHVSLKDQMSPLMGGPAAQSGSGPSAAPSAWSNTAAPYAPGKQGIANMILQSALNRGYSMSDATHILAYAIGESSLNPGISGGNQGGDEVIGLFQEKSAFSGGHDVAWRQNPQNNINAYLDQLERHRGLPIDQALPATSVGGPLATGPGSAPQAWGPLLSQAQGYARNFPGSPSAGPSTNSWAGPLPAGGGGGNGPFFPAPGQSGPGVGGAGGLGPVFPSPGGGPGTGPTLIGGLAPKQGTGKGGIGMQGGILGSLVGAASSAAGLATSGAAMGMDGGMGGAAASAAMQIGIQEINRAIQFGGQAAGILADGLVQTFLPFGASELAQNNWLTRIIGGVVGAGVMLPNIAGGANKKTPEGLTPEQAAQYQGQNGPKPEDVAGKGGQGGTQQGGNGANINSGNTYNTTIQTNKDTISGAANDWNYHLQQGYQGPGN